MSTNGILVALVGLTLGVSSYVALSVGQRGAVSPAGGSSQGGAETAAVTKADLEDLRDEIRQLGLRIDRRMGSLDGRLSRVAQAGGGIASGVAGEAGSAATQDQVDSLAEALEKRLDLEGVGERMKKLEEDSARERNKGGEWKAPMGELAQELELTEAQQAEARKVFDGGRDEVYALVKTMRLDGGSLLDDFVEDLRDGGDPEESGKELFRRIFTEDVPGSDRTYLVEVLAIREQVEKDLSQHLNEKQMRKLKELNVDLTDVKTGYDPVGDYVQAKLQ